MVNIMAAIFDDVIFFKIIPKKREPFSNWLDINLLQG
jgi:hypothetical protein